MSIFPTRGGFTIFNTALLCMFLAAWLYTEIVEHQERDKRWNYIEGFVLKGERFTAEDGRMLEARIRRLEEIAGITPVPPE